MRTSCFLIHVVSLLSIVTASTYAPQSKTVVPPKREDCIPCYRQYKRCLMQHTIVDLQLCSCVPAYISCQATANPLCLDQQNPENIKALCLSDFQAFTSNGKLSCGTEACDGKATRYFLPMQADDDAVSAVVSAVNDDEGTAASEAQSDAESAASEAQSDAESAASSAADAASSARSDAESAASSARSDAESAASSLADDDDFPGWAIALIIVGALLLLLALVGALLAMKAAKKKKNKPRKGPVYAPPPPPPPPVVAPPPPVLATAAPVVYNDGFYDYPYEASMYSGMDPYY